MLRQKTWECKYTNNCGIQYSVAVCAGAQLTCTSSSCSGVALSMRATLSQWPGGGSCGWSVSALMVSADMLPSGDTMHLAFKRLTNLQGVWWLTWLMQDAYTMK